jgi:hypothetical protein
MSPPKQLAWRLPKVPDLAPERHSLHFVRLRVNIHHALIGHGMKEVVGSLRFWAALLDAKDEVDPHVQMLTDVGRLKRLTLQLHKAAGAAVCPGWKAYVVNNIAILPRAKVAAVDVQKKLGQAKKLGNELLDVRIRKLRWAAQKDGPDDKRR